MRIITISPHTSDYPTPISFVPGDRLLLGKRDSEYPGWVWVTTSSGEEGWAPEVYIAPNSSNEGIALEPYTAKELNTVPGESLISHRELSDWLWVENKHGECGWVPKKTTNYA